MTDQKKIKVEQAMKLRCEYKLKFTFVQLIILTETIYFYQLLLDVIVYSILQGRPDRNKLKATCPSLFGHFWCFFQTGPRPKKSTGEPQFGGFLVYY